MAKHRHFLLIRKMCYIEIIIKEDVFVRSWSIEVVVFNAGKHYFAERIIGLNNEVTELLIKGVPVKPHVAGDGGLDASPQHQFIARHINIDI